MTAPDFDVVLLSDGGQVVTIPLGLAHAEATVTPCEAGGWLAVCVCGQVRMSETEGSVRQLLAAHIDGTEVAS